MRRLVVGYYGATLLFLVLDYALGWNFRIAGLQGHPAWRAGYYGLCFGCLAAMMRKPNLWAPLALVESSVNFLVLVLGVFLPLLTLTGNLETAGTVDPESFRFGTPEIANFLLTGGMIIASFQRAVATMARRTWP